LNEFSRPQCHDWPDSSNKIAKHGRMKTLISQRGAALVELAIALPLLVLILLATVDFARVFYSANELTNAARAGAQLGAASVANSGNPGLITAQVAAASPDIGAITVSAVPSCWCATDTGAFGPLTACTTTCVSPGHLVVSVKVTASKLFTTISPFPGIPNSLTISRSATMRAR
jgi:Flp pilus assembly protein TadG